MAKHMVRLRTSIKMDPEDLPIDQKARLRTGLWRHGVHPHGEKD